MIQKIKNTMTPKNVEKAKKEKTKKANKWLWSLSAISFSLMLAWIILGTTGYQPTDYFVGLWEGNFGSWYGFTNLLAQMSWLIPLGLAMVVSFRAGVFNIGSAGQFMLGGLAGYYFAASVDIGRIGMLFTILIPMIVAGSLAYGTAKLKTKFGINEVISSIMLNWVVFFLFKMLTSAAYVPEYMNNATMNPIFANNSLDASWISNSVEGTQLGWGIFLAAIALALIVIAYKYTTFGVKQDILGSNPTVTDYIGDNKTKQMTRAMVISGALAGLAASIYYFGLNSGIQPVANDIPAYAFNGISLALIAYSSPIGILGSSLLIGAMNNAQPAISAIGGIDKYMSDLIQALIVWTISITNYFITYRPQDKLINWIKDYDEGTPKVKDNKEKEAKASKKQEHDKEATKRLKQLKEKYIVSFKDPTPQKGGRE